MTRSTPPARVAAEAGAEHWRAAAIEQRHARLDHADFYVLAGEVVQTLRALEELARLLADQVPEYRAGRLLYDDEGRRPADRLAEATAGFAGCAVTSRPPSARPTRSGPRSGTSG